MILAHNWPKTAKSLWHCPFNWTEVLFTQEVSGAYTSLLLDSDELKMAFQAQNVSGANKLLTPVIIQMFYACNIWYNQPKLRNTWNLRPQIMFPDPENLSSIVSFFKIAFWKTLSNYSLVSPDNNPQRNVHSFAPNEGLFYEKITFIIPASFCRLALLLTDASSSGLLFSPDISVTDMDHKCQY